MSKIPFSEIPQISYGTNIVLRHNLVDHVVVWGDASSEQPPVADTLFYDPPWDADPGIPHYEFSNIIAFTDGKNISKTIEKFGAPTWQFVWDCVSSWYTKNRPLKRHKSCLWYGDITTYNTDGYFFGPPTKSKSVKNTRGKYSFKGNKNGRRVTDLFVEPITSMHSSNTHKHSKPLDWVCGILGCCGGDFVYDPFGGSGVCLFAAMQLGGVKTYTVEVDPEQCLSIVSGAVSLGAEIISVE